MVLIAFIAILPLTFFGQAKSDQAKTDKKTSSFSPYWYVLGDLGAATFHGDLAQYGFAFDPKFIKLNGHIGGGYQFGGVLGANLKLGRGYLGGEKDELKAVLKYNDYFEGNVNLTINMVNLILGTDQDRLFSVSPHFGVGQIHWKAKAVSQANNAVVVGQVGYDGSTGGPNSNGGNKNGFIGNDRMALTVPVGLDLGFNINPKWDLYLDYTINFVDSDQVDAFAHGTKMMKKDMYSTLNVGARYKFGSSGAKKMAKNFDQLLVEATPSVMVEKGDSVLVTVKGAIPPKYFDKKSAMNITPVIMYEGGSTVLPPISLKGENAVGNGQVINYKNGGTFTQTYKVPYNPSMNVSELVFAPMIYTPKSETQATREAIQEKEQYFTADQRKLADGVIYTSKRLDEKGMVTSTTAHGYEKVTLFAKNANLYFKVNQADLDLKLPLNKNAENGALLQGITTDIQKGWAVKDITITGWASPEGEETFNAGLSDRRANTTEKYVKDQLNKLAKDKNAKVSYTKADDISFAKSGNGPDWNGFMNAVESSTIKDKNAILNVVRSAAAAQREQEIRNMILIYPELEKDILPPLRRAGIIVNSFEPKRTDAEISSIALSSPETLSLNELLYAASMASDPADKKSILDNTMRLHPTCMRAVVNAADAEIALGNYDTAKSLLEKALTMSDKSAEVYNNLGVINVHQKDYVAAEQNFTKAKQLGADVAYNEGIVNIYKGNYAEAVASMKATKCDYNLGLAQTLNGDLAGAKSTLDCAPATGEAFYLKAIIGARSNDKEALYSNLMKAIQKDEDYKNQAKWDREFMNYFNEQDFMNIVK